MLELNTLRLRIRPLAEIDRDLYQELYRDPVTMRHIAPPCSAAEAKRAFALALARNALPLPNDRVWTMTLRDGGETVGVLGLTVRDREAEVGALLAAPWRGRRLVTEAIVRLMEHAFDDLGLVRLHGRQSPANAVSIALMTRLGFQALELPEEPALNLGWTLTRERWAKHSPRTRDGVFDQDTRRR